MTRNQDQDAYQELIETFIIQAERLASILASASTTGISMSQLSADYNRQYGPGCWRSVQTSLTFQTFLELFPRTFALRPSSSESSLNMHSAFSTDTPLPAFDVILTHPRIRRIHDSKKEVRQHYLTRALSSSSSDSSHNPAVSGGPTSPGENVEAKLTHIQLLPACLPTSFHLFYTRSSTEADRFCARHLQCRSVRDTSVAIPVHEIGFALSTGGRGNVALIQVATKDTAMLFHVCHAREGVPPRLKEVLEDDQVVKVAFDGKAEAKKLEALGVDCENVVDTAKIAVQNGHRRLFMGAKKVACYLNLKVEKRQVRSPWDAADLSEAQRAMAAMDAWLALRCYQVISHTRSRLLNHQTAHRFPLHLFAATTSAMSLRRDAGVACATDYGYQLVGEVALGDNARRLVFEQERGRERVDEEIIAQGCEGWEEEQ
ncbi:ribonuclease H-like domain-containing protein [Endogone sp. FLAS-F59071]|nr:ribonuclease H-like domain-containing protein [Endogone sp. FLAS-F59071]|eukprot:RUS21161.1 ribonuclease H-like domain-containing protein [Endogone sp. FLAS-F59071]